MCGIFIVVGPDSVAREENLRLAGAIKHRGPDQTGEYITDGLHMIHHRLAIVNPNSGAQPIVNVYGAVAVNGEIYNYKELAEQLGRTEKQISLYSSDCEVINELMFKNPAWVTKLVGMYAFAYFNTNTRKLFIARDPVGIIPLYYCIAPNGSYYFASELKCLPHHGMIFQGTKYINLNKIRCPSPMKIMLEAWEIESPLLGAELSSPKLTLRSLKGIDENERTYFKKSGFISANSTQIREKMLKTIRGYLPSSPIRYAVLLSGGLDSSIIAGAVRHILGPDEPIYTFSVGLIDSPDLIAARVMAKWINSIHQEVHFTIQEGIDLIPQAVLQLETFDITTIRAGIPMLILAKKIHEQGFKVVLSGEGSDEVWAGYKYFHYAPEAELFDELVRKINTLHWYDCRRANMAMMTHSIELRVPFLDTEFLNFAMTIDPKDKMPRSINIDEEIQKNKENHFDKPSGNELIVMEKIPLRLAFMDLLPRSICWRSKEQFSDGVGHQWINTLRDSFDSQEYLDKKSFAEAELFSAEHYYYYKCFVAGLPLHVSCVPNEKSIACSSATAIKWKKEWDTQHDPSGLSC